MRSGSVADRLGAEPAIETLLYEEDAVGSDVTYGRGVNKYGSGLGSA